MSEGAVVSADSAQGERERLEIEKLKVELADLKRPAWKKPAYLGVFLPMGLAVFTLLGGIISGYFDAQRERLKAEKEALQTQTRILRQEGQAVIHDLLNGMKQIYDPLDEKQNELQELIDLLRSEQMTVKEVTSAKEKAIETAKKAREKLGEVRQALKQNEAKLRENTAFAVTP